MEKLFYIIIYSKVIYITFINLVDVCPFAQFFLWNNEKHTHKNIFFYWEAFSFHITLSE